MESLLFFGLLGLLAIGMYYRFVSVVLLFPLLFLSYLWSYTIFGIPVTFLEVATWMLGLFWCLYAWKHRGSETKKTASLVWWKSYIPGIILLLLGTGLSFLVIPQEVLFHRGMPGGPEYETFATLRIALGIVKGWVIAPLVYFFVLVRTIKTRTDMDCILWSFVWSAVILSVVSLGELVMAGGVDRLQGPFLSPNYLAMYIAPAFLLGCVYTARLWQQHKRWKSLGVWILVLLLGFVLALTKTYASWIGVVVALVVALYFVCSPRGRVWAYSLLFLCVIGGIAVLAPTEKFQRFFDTAGDSSTAVRLEVYEIAVGLLEQSPWLGIGPGQFEAQYKVQGPEILGHLPKEWVMLHPHNTMLSMWLYAGVLGVLGWFWLLLSFFVRTGRNMLYFWPLVVVMTLLMVHGLFDMYFWKNDVMYLFWMLLGCSTVLPRFHFLGMKKK